MTNAAIIEAVLRDLHVTALVSLFGTLLLAEDARLRRMLVRPARISVVCALLAGLAWLVVDSAVIAGADNFVATLRAAPVVAFQTHYGQWFVGRCALLAVVLALPLARRAALAIVLVIGGVALAIQPGTCGSNWRIGRR